MLSKFLENFGIKKDPNLGLNPPRSPYHDHWICQARPGLRAGMQAGLSTAHATYRWPCYVPSMPRHGLQPACLASRPRKPNEPFLALFSHFWDINKVYFNCIFDQIIIITQKFKFRILLLVIKKNDDQYFSDTKCRIPWEQYLKDWFSVKV